MSAAVHVFFDIHMGASHKALTEILSGVARKDLKQGESAVFLNGRWDACKILYADGVIVYWRSPTGAPISIDALRFLPQKLATKLAFTQKGETSILREFESRFGKKMASMKIAYA